MQFDFLENYKLKLTSILVAFLFWFVVATENDYQYDLDVPIQTVNVPADKIIVNRMPELARIRFSGRGKSLLALSFYSEAELELDVGSVKRAASLALTPDMVHILRRSQGVSGWQILSPDSVIVELASVLEKNVAIVPQIAVEPVNGYSVVGGVQIVPDSVMIRGPENIVRKIKEIETEPLEFKDKKYRFSGKVGLQSFPDTLKIHLPISQANFFVDVQKLLEIQIDEIPVQITNVPSTMQVTPLPSTLSLTVVGGEGLLMRLRRDDFKAYIDYSRTYEHAVDGHPAYIETPDGVRVVRVHPQRFKLIKDRSRRK